MESNENRENQVSSLFRQKSIDRISSPEQMHDYMRVTSPKLWMLLAAIVAMLTGFIIYASTTTMESTVDVNVQASYELLMTCLPESELEIIKLNMPVRIAGTTGRISDISLTSGLMLEVEMKDGSTPPEGSCELVFGSLDAPEEERFSNTYYLSVFNGHVFGYDGTGELAKRLREEPGAYLAGKACTVTGFEASGYASLFITLDKANTSLPDGMYRAEVITESTTPIRFLLN